jgi:hypothetical protein
LLDTIPLLEYIRRRCARRKARVSLVDPEFEQIVFAETQGAFARECAATDGRKLRGVRKEDREVRERQHGECGVVENTQVFSRPLQDTSGRARVE